MDKTAVLCRMNRLMMEEFSRRTIAGLQRHTLFRVMLPIFNSFLELNVRKEVEKDRQVIMRAEELYLSGTTPGDQDVRGLLQQAKEVDRAFLQQVSIFPIAIKIDYAEIEKVRHLRVGHLLHESHRILSQWANSRKFTTTISELYDADEFNAILYDILRLYSVETESLSHSVRLPAVMFVARNSLTRTVSTTMQDAAKSLAAQITGRIYRQAD